MCSISTNIFMVLANFLDMQNSISSKNINHDSGNTMSYITGWQTLFFKLASGIMTVIGEAHTVE